jgi:hypothetical protein
MRDTLNSNDSHWVVGISLFAASLVLHGSVFYSLNRGLELQNKRLEQVGQALQNRKDSTKEGLFQKPSKRLPHCGHDMRK